MDPFLARELGLELERNPRHVVVETSNEAAGLYLLYIRGNATRDNLNVDIDECIELVTSTHDVVQDYIAPGGNGLVIVGLNTQLDPLGGTRLFPIPGRSSEFVLYVKPGCELALQSRDADSQGGELASVFFYPWSTCRNTHHPSPPPSTLCSPAGWGR